MVLLNTSPNSLYSGGYQGYNLDLSFRVFNGGGGHTDGRGEETLSMSLLGVMRVMDLHPQEAQKHQELSSDGYKERDALLVHGVDVECNGLSAVSF